MNRPIPAACKFTKWLPGSWRMPLLEALAWPEFSVTQTVFVGTAEKPDVVAVPVFGVIARPIEQQPPSDTGATFLPRTND